MASGIFVHDCLGYLHLSLSDNICKYLVEHIALCPSRGSLLVYFLHSLCPVSNVDDVPGFSVMDSGRRVIAVVPMSEVKPIVYYLQMILILALPIISRSSTLYLAIFSTSGTIHSITRIHCFSLKWPVPRVPFAWTYWPLKLPNKVLQLFG